VYFVTKQLYFVLFLTENKMENKEARSQIKQHWLVIRTSLTQSDQPWCMSGQMAPGRPT
jgi:hypothetical protein